MKNIIAKSLFLFILLVSVNLSAQRRGGQGKHNMFGLKLGLTQFDIKTDNFITSPSSGFIGGIATRGDFYNNMDIQLGMNISNNNIKVQAKEALSSQIQDVEYGLLNAQVQILFGYKIIGNNRNMQSKFKLTAELGPVLMVNSKMKLSKKNQEGFIIEKANVTAKELTDISGININGLGGLSMGWSILEYLDITNMDLITFLNKLNDIEGNTTKFKGHVSMFQFGSLIYFYH